MTAETPEMEIVSGTDELDLIGQLDQTVTYAQDQMRMLEIGTRWNAVGALATVVLGNGTREETYKQREDFRAAADIAVTLKKIVDRVAAESDVNSAENVGFTVTTDRDVLTVETDEAGNVLLSIGPIRTNQKTTSLYATYLDEGVFANDGIHVDGQYVLGTNGAVCHLDTNGSNGNSGKVTEPELLHAYYIDWRNDDRRDEVFPNATALYHYLELFTEPDIPLAIEPILPQRQRPTELVVPVVTRMLLPH